MDSPLASVVPLFSSTSFSSLQISPSAKGKRQAKRMKMRAQSAEQEIAGKNEEIAKLTEQLAARSPGPSSTNDGDSGEGGGELRGDGDGDNEGAGVRSDSEEEEQEDPLCTGHSGELPYST